MVRVKKLSSSKLIFITHKIEDEVRQLLSAQTQKSHALLTCFSESELGVDGVKGVEIPEDTEVSGEENEQLQKKIGELFHPVKPLTKGISACSLFPLCLSMFSNLRLPRPSRRRPAEVTGCLL